MALETKHKELYERYRTIAFERANAAGEGDVGTGYELNFGSLLPADRQARILDIGCGMGHFLTYLKSKGYECVAGVDLSAEQVEYCRNQGCDNVRLVEDLPQFLSDASGQWDCITLLDVIEHLPREQVMAVLKGTYSALRPGGSVIIETGNLASFSGVYLRYIDFTHESGFTENSMRQVLRGAGFETIAITGSKAEMYSWRSRILRAGGLVWEGMLRLIYRLERGWESAPHILAKNLIARGHKRG